MVFLLYVLTKIGNGLVQAFLYFLISHKSWKVCFSVYDGEGKEYCLTYLKYLCLTGLK